MAIVANRKELVKVLERAGKLASRNAIKPILRSVRLAVRGDELSVVACDGEVTVQQSLSIEGDAGDGWIECVDLEALLKRVKAGTADECVIDVEDVGVDTKVIVNGGKTTHTLFAIRDGEAEFPAYRDFPPVGPVAIIDAATLREALRVALLAAAKEISRYAINGVFIERTSEGVRFVATDGRRLVRIPVKHVDASDGTWSGIIPGWLCARMDCLLRAVPAGQAVAVHTTPETKVKQDKTEIVTPGEVWFTVSEPKCVVSAFQVEGRFPKYEDVVYPTGQRWELDVDELRGAIKEVSITCCDENRAMKIDARMDGTIRLETRDPSLGESVATIVGEYLGSIEDGPATHPDYVWRSAINPVFLLDVLRSMPGGKGGRIVLDVSNYDGGMRPSNWYPAGPADVGADLWPMWTVMCISREGITGDPDPYEPQEPQEEPQEETQDVAR